MTLHNAHPSRRQPRLNRGQEAGVALLIAIFTLLLISAVAVSLVLASGTESSLASNYRSSASAYYAGLAGLEEARGRLLPSNPNFFNIVTPNFITVVGPNPTLLIVAGVPQVRYITNPLPGEVVDPVNPANQYFDNEYSQEWSVAPAVVNPPPVGAGTQYIGSISGAANIQGPMYKWVRITPATEQSLGLDVNGDGAIDTVNAIYYDPQHVDGSGNPDPSLIVSPLTPTQAQTASQVFQIAALAVLPNGTKKIVEYVAAPQSFNLNLPSALNLPGPIGSFNPPNSGNYCMDGNDTSQAASGSIPACPKFAAPPAVPGCTGTGTSNPAIAVSPGNDNAGNTTNTNYVDNAIPRPCQYLGSGANCTANPPALPVGTPALPPNMATPAQLVQELSVIQQNANVCLGSGCPPPQSGSSPYNFSNIDSAPGSLWGSCGTNCPNTPQITYVNGNLDITGSTHGSGILVVTGNLTYSGDSSWNGIILVVGQGLTTYTQNGGGSGQFNGAVFVANVNGNPPGTWGPADFTINGGGGNGLYYNSCWIQNSQKPITLKVLSFHEIPNQ